MKKRVKDLIIRTKRAVFSEYSANHPSIFAGDGLDFSELREYDISDDAKKIDHKTTAKKQKPYVKIYKNERELNIATICLLGGSLYFGTKILKKDFCAQIVSTIAISAISYQDRFSNFIYTNKMEKILKPTKKINFAAKAIEDIFEFMPLGKKVDFKNLEEQINKYIKKRSIIFIIGDFFEIYDFKKLNIKHEIIVIIIRDRFEEKLEELNLIYFSDPVDKKTISVDLDKNFIQSYRQKIKSFDHKLFEELKKAKVRFVKIYTDENPIKKLKKLFAGTR